VRVRYLVIGFAAVALAACGGGSPASTSGTSAKASPSPSGRGANAARNGVAGKIVQLTGTQLVVNGQNGNATVTYDTSTMVVQAAPGSLKDAAPGACINVTGQKDASGAIQATLIQLMFNMNGNCTPPPGANANGNGAGGQGRGPGASPGAGGGQGQGGAANLTFDRGKITAIQGTFLTVQSNTQAVLTVNVPATATVTKIQTIPASTLAVGQCVAANGQRDASGNVTARLLSIAPPNANGDCPTGIFGAFGGGGRGRPSPRPSGSA
jgi:hypothetical protein